MGANEGVIPGEKAQDTPPFDIKKGTLLEIDATRDITSAEHDLGFWDAVKQYPSAVFWAVCTFTFDFLTLSRAKLRESQKRHLC
jgi:hypothetical protein